MPIDASATIFIDFIYQITLFVAFLTLDERRMVASRERAKEEGRYLYIANIYAEFRSHRPGCQNLQTDNPDEKLFTQRIMGWYAKQLLRPRVKQFVLALFSGLFVLCFYKTTQLRQAFDVADYVPADSYTKDFFPARKYMMCHSQYIAVQIWEPNTYPFTSVDQYSSLKVPMTVYFRNVNQSDPVIQQEMRDFIETLSGLPQIQQPPDFCWVRDLNDYMSGDAIQDLDEDEKYEAELIANAIRGENRTFNEQLDVALGIPAIRDVFGGDISRDEAGNIIASRCYLFVRHIDLKSIHEQTALLYAQRELTANNQPAITAGNDELSFFSFDEIFYYWELVSVWCIAFRKESSSVGYSSSHNILCQFYSIRLPWRNSSLQQSQESLLSMSLAFCSSHTGLL